MKIYEFTTSQVLPRPRDEVFDFFADATNLGDLTPPWLHFEICAHPERIQRGARIDYRLRVHGIPLRWRTLISAWDPPHRFVDEQLRGPYRLWHHEHRFESVDNGTRVQDRVRYSPLGGRLIHWLFVRRDVTRIFAYRADALAKRFAPQTAHKN